MLLSVADTGQGIQEEDLETLFDRYLHKNLMDPQPHGLGLGLPLCRRIAEGHGGRLLAESKTGVGSRFTLSIPDQRTDSGGVSDVPLDYTGGFNRTLLALADALPAEAFLRAVRIEHWPRASCRGQCFGFLFLPGGVQWS